MYIKHREILSEIQEVLDRSDFQQLDNFTELLINSKTVITFGAGRVGLAMQGFGKRLRHLGLNSFFLNDSTVPASGDSDLFLIGSGSGHTKSVVVAAEVAKARGVRVALITAQDSSPLHEISDCRILLKAPNKLESETEFKSRQPLTTLFEQSIYIFLDALVLELMNKLNETTETMWKRHNVIE